jgi:hypothetical protein
MPGIYLLPYWQSLRYNVKNTGESRKGQYWDKIVVVREPVCALSCTAFQVEIAIFLQ